MGPLRQFPLILSQSLYRFQRLYKSAEVFSRRRGLRASLGSGGHGRLRMAAAQSKGKRRPHRLRMSDSKHFRCQSGDRGGYQPPVPRNWSSEQETNSSSEKKTGSSFREERAADSPLPVPAAAKCPGGYAPAGFPPCLFSKFMLLCSLCKKSILPVRTRVRRPERE